MNIGKLFRRFWAFCFDIIIVFGIYWGILFLIEIPSDFNGVIMLLEQIHNVSLSKISICVLCGQAHYIALFYLLYILLFLIYELSFLSSKLSATPGKLVLELEVACYKGSDLLTVFKRSLLKATAILIFPLILLLFLISVFSKTKQSLHDKFSDTCVVTKDKSNLLGANPQMPLEEFFEEMKSRGLRLYSEQKTLSKEIYGSTIPLAKVNYIPTSSHSLLGILILFFSIVINAGFAFYIKNLYTLF